MQAAVGVSMFAEAPAYPRDPILCLIDFAASLVSLVFAHGETWGGTRDIAAVEGAGAAVDGAPIHGRVQPALSLRVGSSSRWARLADMPCRRERREGDMGRRQRHGRRRGCRRRRRAHSRQSAAGSLFESRVLVAVGAPGRHAMPARAARGRHGGLCPSLRDQQRPSLCNRLCPSVVPT
jgi:hypothetical protein